MLKNLALLVGYAKAPRVTFVARHPRAGIATLAVVQGLRESRTARKVAGTLFGLGAASVALPVAAFWLIRR
jgi:hypothetical protein